MCICFKRNFITDRIALYCQLHFLKKHKSSFFFDNLIRSSFLYCFSAFLTWTHTSGASKRRTSVTWVTELDRVSHSTMPWCHSTMKRTYRAWNVTYLAYQFWPKKDNYVCFYLRLEWRRSLCLPGYLTSFSEKTPLLRILIVNISPMKWIAAWQVHLTST